MQDIELLNDYFSKHYQYLLSIAKQITYRHVKCNRNEFKHNLLHEVYLSMASRISKHSKHSEFLKSETDFKKYTTHYLKQFFVWQRNLRFINKKDNALFTYEQPYDDAIVHVGLSRDRNDEIVDKPNELTDEKAEQLIYLNAENTDDITKMFLTDLILNDIDIEKGMMVNKIKSVAKTLDLIEYQIFDMYFLQELSCLDIYNELKSTNKNYMSYLSIRKKQKEVKQKIIDKLKW